MAEMKRTRTKKTVSEAETTDNNNVDEVSSAINDNSPCEEPVTKKRGRKPRGSKIIEGCDKNDISNVAMPNVIVHFRCSITELGATLESSGETVVRTQENTGEYSRFTEVKQVRGNNNETTDNRKPKQPTSGSSGTNGTIAPSDSAYGAKGSALGFAPVDEVDKQEIFLDVREEDMGIWMPNGDPRKSCINGCSGGAASSSVDVAEINERISEMEVNFNNNTPTGSLPPCSWIRVRLTLRRFTFPKQ